MKKSLLLVMAAIGFAATPLSAETLNLTFNRTGTTAQSVTVNASGIEGVTASCTSTNYNFKTVGSITSGILCPDANANANPTITLKFSVAGIPAGAKLESMDLDIHAFNISGAYQDPNDGKNRHWNIDIATDAATVDTRTDMDIAKGVGTSGNVHKEWNFAPAQALDVNDPTEITITLTKGTDNGGCFFGLSSIKLNLDLSGVTTEPDPVDPDLYCKPTQTTSVFYRYLKDFTLTGENGNTVTVTADQPRDFRPIYKDVTTTVFTANQGEEISIVGTGSQSEWMGQWLYIDFANDGFLIDEIKVADDHGAVYGNDLVSFNSLKGSDETFYNSWGNVSGGNVTMNTEENARSHMPEFNIPGYLAPGDYRARYILQFNSLNPCGVFDAAKEDDNITNGGTIIDFMIHVDPTDFAVNSTSTLKGEATGEIIIAKGIDENGNPVDELAQGTEVIGGTTLHAFVTPGLDCRVAALTLTNGKFRGKAYTLNADEFETLPDGTLHIEFLVNGNVDLAATFAKDVEITYAIEGRGTAKISSEVTDIAYKGTTTKIIAATPAGEIIDQPGQSMFATAGSTVHVFAAPEEANSVITFNPANTQGFSLMFGNNGADGDPHFVDTDGDGTQDASYIFFEVPDSDEPVNVTIHIETSLLEIDTVINDLNAGNAQAYDLRGIRVNATDLVRGNIYILRTGNTIQKVLVK